MQTRTARTYSCWTKARMHRRTPTRHWGWSNLRCLRSHQHRRRHCRQRPFHRYRRLHQCLPFRHRRRRSPNPSPGPHSPSPIRWCSRSCLERKHTAECSNRYTPGLLGRCSRYSRRHPSHRHPRLRPRHRPPRPHRRRRRPLLHQLRFLPSRQKRPHPLFPRCHPDRCHHCCSPPSTPR